jgi:hypothetical protein
VEHKWKRVRNFHDATVHNFIEILGAAGLSQPSDLKPWHILRRISATEVRSLDEVYHYIQSGALLTSPIPAAFERDWERANPDSFLPRSVSLIL